MTVEEPPPDWLPDGWIMEVRRRSRGGTYKCYTAPLTGHKLYSKTEVYRYLKTGKLRKRSRQKRKDTNTPSPTNVTVSINYFEEGLPPGWIRGVKVKEAGSRIRRDAFYIDPVTGHEFRSKKEVFNYLKTGEVHKRGRKPKKRLIADVESTCQEISLPAGAERTELADSRTRRYLLTGECLKGCKIIMDKPVRESSVNKEQKFSVDAFDRCVTGGTTSEVSAMNSLEGPVSREIKINKSLTEGRLISASNLALILMEKQPLMIDMTKLKNENCQSDSRKKDKGGLNFMCRTSKRIADLRAKQALGQFNQGENPPVNEQLKDYEKPVRNQEAEEERSENHETDRENIEEDLEPESPVTMIEERIGNFETGNGETKPYPPITSMGECVEKLETDENWKPRSPIVLPEEFTENVETNYKSILEPALPITLPEEVCGSSATAKEIDAKQDLKTACPFGESWPDPCLEFAFKTLAGEISVEADFVIQNYFERQSNPVPYQNTNGLESSDLCVDKFLQTDDAPLQLGLLDKPASSTQLQENAAPISSGRTRTENKPNTYDYVK